MNEGHRAVVEYQEYCQRAEDKKCLLVTQNIDDLHCRAIKASKVLQTADDKYTVDDENTRVAFTPFVHEIHGNSHYMHCSEENQEHSKKFYPCPTYEEFEAAAAAAPEP